MRGIAYGVGVGPGDPELMTLKAVNIIKNCDVIAYPGESEETSVALNIVKAAVPEVVEKTLIRLSSPMVRDDDKIRDSHLDNAKTIENYLGEGKNVICLTLGDPTIYSTFSYIQDVLRQDGYETALISGVPSFCAAAARLNIPLATWQEEIHIVPSAHKAELRLEDGTNYVLMKAGKNVGKIKEALEAQCGTRGEEAMNAPSGTRLEEAMEDSDAVVKKADAVAKNLYAVENCGMIGEKVYKSLEEMPDESGYFTTIIVK